MFARISAVHPGDVALKTQIEPLYRDWIVRTARDWGAALPQPDEGGGP